MGGQRWRVVASNGTGGIAVREEVDMKSKIMPRRLELNALVEQEEQDNNRIRFSLVEGEGPSSGWVSVVMAGKDQLVKEGPAPDRATSQSRSAAKALGLSAGGGEEKTAPPKQTPQEYWASFAPRTNDLKEGRPKHNTRPQSLSLEGGKVPSIVHVSFEEYDAIDLNGLVSMGWPQDEAQKFKALPVDQRRAFLQEAKQYALKTALEAGDINFTEALACGAEFRLMTIDDAATVLRGIINFGGGGPEHVSAAPLR